MTRLSSVLQLQMRLIAITHKLPVMSWEWWRCIEIRHSRWSRLKCQTPTSFQGEVKEQHRPLQLVEVFPRWTLCRFASLGFRELRGIVVPRWSEKIVRDTRLIITLGNYNAINAVWGIRYCLLLLSKRRSNFAGSKWHDISMHCSGTHSAHFTWS